MKKIFSLAKKVLPYIIRYFVLITKFILRDFWKGCFFAILHPLQAWEKLKAIFSLEMEELDNKYFEELTSWREKNFLLFLTIGKLAIIFGFFGFMLWAVFVPLDEGIIAQGFLTVSSKTKSVQHLEGGTIKEILIKNGNEIVLGQPLIILEDTQIRSELNSLKIRYWTTLAIISRLKAEIDAKKAVEYSTELLDIRVLNKSVNEILDIQTRLFFARTIELNGRGDILKKQIKQLDQQVLGLKEQFKSQKEILVFTEDELSRLKKLIPQIEITRVINVEKEKSQIHREISSLKSSLAQIGVRRAEVELEILQLEKIHEQEAIEALLNARESSFEYVEQIKGLEDRLNKSNIVAPQSGKITKLQVHTIGGIISPGMILMDIVPNDELVVDVRVLPQDVDNVSEGLDVKIRLGAFKNPNVPMLNGKVKSISADAVINEESGAYYYTSTVTISKDDEFQKIIDLELELLPGMPTDVLVLAGKRTLLEYLIAPIKDLVFSSLKEE